MTKLAVISMNFSRARRQADELERIAHELQNLAQSELPDSLSQLSGGWTGESANLFIQKGNNLAENIIKTARQLLNAANALRKSAAAIYESERKAELIAIQRRENGAGGGGSSGGR